MRKKGTSLVEVLISIALVMVMLLMYITFLNLIKLNKKDQDLSMATFLASQEIEIIKNLPFSSLTNRTDALLIGDIDLSVLNEATGVLTISNYQDNPDIKQINIKINWIDKTLTKNVELSTLISSYGLSQE